MKITSTRKLNAIRRDKIHAVRILPLGGGSLFDTDYVVTYRVVTNFGMAATLPRFHHNVTPSSMKRIQRLIAHWTRRAIEGGIECLRRNRDEEDVEYLPGGDAGLFPAAHPRTFLVTIPAMDNHGDYPLRNKITIRLHKHCPICGAERGEVTHGAISYDGSRRLYDVDTWMDGCGHYTGYLGHRQEAFLMNLNPGYHYQAGYDVRQVEAQHEDAPRTDAIGGGNGAAVEEDDTANALENEIAASVHKIRQLQDQAEEIAVRMSEAKDRLEALLKVRGSNWQDDNGYARLIAGSTRTAYQKDALDALIINDPLEYGWLKDYRKETTLGAYVQVK